MPKVVDPAHRRTQIVDAVFTLVERAGVDEASLRNVATEAGLNVGSVRHYVDGAEGMLVDARDEMGRRVADRVTARVEAFYGTQEPAERTGAELLEFAVDLFEELLPLDEQRRREVAVWLAFSEYARVRPSLRPTAAALIDGARLVARPVVNEGGAPDGEVRTEMLASTVDGLALALLHDPDRLTREEIRRVLRLAITAAVGGGSAEPGGDGRSYAQAVKPPGSDAGS